MTRAVYEDVLSEYAGLESSLAAPAVPRDHLRARRLRRCVAELGPLHAAAVRLREVEEDLAAAVELEWEAEAERLSAQAAELRDDLAARLALRDPRDPFDVVVFVEGEPERVPLALLRSGAVAPTRGPGSPGRTSRGQGWTADAAGRDEVPTPSATTPRSGGCSAAMRCRCASGAGLRAGNVLL